MIVLIWTQLLTGKKKKTTSIWQSLRLDSMKDFKFNLKKWNFSHDTITCQDQTWLVYLTAFQKTLKQYLSRYAGPAVQSQFEIKMYYDVHIIQLFSTGKYFIAQATPDSPHKYISIDLTQLNSSRILEVCNIGWDLLNNKKRFFGRTLKIYCRHRPHLSSI